MPSSLASYGNGPPPLKPKPLHLTVSYRPHYERKVAQTSYQASSGSVRLLIPTEWALEGSNGLDVAALGPLAGDHYNDDGWAASNDGRILSVYNTARTSTPESSLLPGKRTSIYFNPHQPNPFHAPLNAGEQSTVNHTAASSDLRDDDTPIMIDLPDSDRALRARAIHDFSGEGDFGELSFTRGTILAIEAEDVGGGWSAGFIVTGEATSGETVAASSGNIERGLIPTGFYAVGGYGTAQIPLTLTLVVWACCSYCPHSFLQAQPWLSTLSATSQTKPPTWTRRAPPRLWTSRTSGLRATRCLILPPTYRCLTM